MIWSVEMLLGRRCRAGFTLRAWAASGLLLLGGCASVRNERIAIGTRATASFGGGTGPGMALPARAGTDLLGPVKAPSPGRLDRSRWRTMVVVAPIDCVVHTETYRGVALVGRRAAAERAGVFPVPGGLSEPSWIEDLGTTADELGRALMDPMLAPLRLIYAGRGGWWTWSPYEIWKRTRQDRPRWSAVGGTRKESTHD